MDRIPTMQPLSALAKWAMGLGLFIGVGALFGGGMMLSGLDAFGMGPMLEDLRKLPLKDVFFNDFTWPGVFLIMVNGLPQTMTAALLLLRRPIASKLVMVCAVLLAGWLAIQWLIFALNPLTTIYSLLAIGQFAMGLTLYRRQRQQTSLGGVTAIDRPLGTSDKPGLV